MVDYALRRPRDRYSGAVKTTRFWRRGLGGQAIVPISITRPAEMELCPPNLMNRADHLDRFHVQASSHDGPATDTCGQQEHVGEAVLQRLGDRLNASCYACGGPVRSLRGPFGNYLKWSTCGPTNSWRGVGERLEGEAGTRPADPMLGERGCDSFSLARLRAIRSRS
jgi:hypothetical protein